MVAPGSTPDLALLHRVDLEVQAECATGGGLPPVFPRPDETKLGHSIVALSAHLPDHGRRALASMRPAVREETRRSRLVLSRSALAPALWRC